ncbi:MAG: carboxypeptidase regulatory-like domain-containing protein, partial [Deltaproteobacteria bacterium]|nr:carboxypeptidase regulatory-like domain-containing protein [Deltaproteobacteria bacterium]
MAALGMAGCIATEGDSGSGEEGENAVGEDGIVEISGALTGTAFIVGMVKDTIGVPVPGVVVKISGPAAHSAVTDSNGVYQFNALPNGTYTVKPSKAGAGFNVTSRNVNATSSGVEAAFTCNAGCEGAAAINEFKELTITDTSVIDDARTSNFTNGPWSFRFLMEQMTPSGTDPSDFVLSWLQGFKASAGPINGRPVDDRL